MNWLIQSARAGARTMACTVLSACLAVSAAAAIAAAPPPPLASRPEVQVGLTLAQAVAQVQRQTAGEVLQASTRQRGQITEYRIKVLTPDGHVHVVSVRTKPAPGRQSKDVKHKENS